MTDKQLILEIKKYFEDEIVERHKVNLSKTHSKLSEYQINPLLIKYLSQLQEGAITPEGITKALFYPRALGTSITGMFGTKFQKMFLHVGLATGSKIAGIDIEYLDKLDGRKKYCQLK